MTTHITSSNGAAATVRMRARGTTVLQTGSSIMRLHTTLRFIWEDTTSIRQQLKNAKKVCPLLLRYNMGRISSPNAVEAIGFPRLMENISTFLLGEVRNSIVREQWRLQHHESGQWRLRHGEPGQWRRFRQLESKVQSVPHRVTVHVCPISRSHLYPVPHRPV